MILILHKSFIIKTFLSFKRHNYLSLILVAMFLSINVTPQISADFTTSTPKSGCGSLLVEFQDLSSGNPDSWLWDFGNGTNSTLKNPTIIYSSPGVYNVSLTISNSNYNDSKISNGFITVFSEPISNITTNSNTDGCMPLLIDFEGITSNNNLIIDWFWDFGDGGSSLLQNPDYEYLDDGSYSVSLMVTDTNGCQNLVTELGFVDVYKKPIADFTSDITISCDSTKVISFTNQSILGTTYYWDFGNGNTSSLIDPTNYYLTGLYDVSLIAKTGNCTDTVVRNNYIEIGSHLNSDFNFNIDSICEGTSVDFTDLTNNNPDSWLWDFGDGNTSVLQNPTHIYSTEGTYDVSLKTSKMGECNNTFIKNNAIKVFAKPIVNISVDTNYSCNLPFDVSFYDFTNNSSSWFWDFGNGETSILKNPTVQYNSYGYYNVILSTTNNKGCTSVIDFNNLIHIEEVNVEINSSTQNGCVPANFVFNDSSNSTRPLVNWLWDFGDGNTSNLQNPTHEYMHSGAFDVELTIVNDYGCAFTKSFSDFIHVNEAPHVEFESNPQVGCVGQDIYFYDLSYSSDSINNWFWDFEYGNTSTFQNPVFQYDLPGQYDVTLIAGIDDCKDTFMLSNYIKIMTPTAKFIEEYNCDSPLTINFNNLSLGADDVIWDFGDGNTSNLLNPTHTYTSKGVYDVKLNVFNNTTGCSHEINKTIKLTIPEANFDYLINANNGYEDSVGCAPKQVYLQNNSQDWDHYKVIWSDGYIGYGRVDHTFNDSGEFDVMMIVTDIHGCRDTMIHNNMYKINDVQADFEITNVLGCDSMLVDFHDLSFPTSLLSWNFGDGNSSNLNNPQHIYYSEGYYDVTIYVESIDGCKDTLERKEYIQFQYPIADFISNDQLICPNDTIEFKDQSIGIGLSYSWDFGDGNTSLDYNPEHIYLANGLYDISLNVIDSFGCSNNIVLSEYISVYGPVADFVSSSVTSNCPPMLSNFSDLSSFDVIDWQWFFSDGSYSNVSNPSHLFSNSGIFDVSLVVTNNLGCRDTLVKNSLIEISGPSGAFSFSDSIICKNDSVEFIPLISNVSFLLWDFGNGHVSTDLNPTISYNSAGYYNPVLLIEDSSGCQVIINNSDSISVRSIDIDAGSDVDICRGEEIQLNAFSNSNQFNWFPSNNLSDSSIQNPFASPISDIMYYFNVTDGLCTETDSVFIQVHENVPNPSFTTFNHCFGDTVDFSASSGILSSNILWEWSFGSLDQNPSYIFLEGTHQIELEITNLDNNCSKKIVQDIEIYPLPIADFKFEDVCLGEEIKFIDNSSSNTVSWSYDFDYNSFVTTSQSPIFLFDSAGYYDVRLSVFSDMGCKSSVLKEVIVHDLPNADFTVIDRCQGDGNIFSGYFNNK